MKYEIWQSERDGKWYWHLRTSNDKVVTDGEGYDSKGAALVVITQLKGSTYVSVETISERESLYGLVDIFSDTEALVQLKHVRRR